MDPRDLIKRPVITERATDLMEQRKYVFEVDRRANKVEIRQAVEHIFGVKVAQVNTIHVPPKPKRVGRFHGYTPAMKKAIVKLTPESKLIDMFGE
ncbi:50S ribosomal protein L23 [Alicyclobacillaceae bacterium I2511]|nr:50S ribosomal protein L23 [Alicyclobacillaceae bacterium I2511]